MANFNTAYNLTDRNEGGYSNKSTDKGGETYRGISRRYWPNWAGWSYIDGLKKLAGWPSVADAASSRAALEPMVAQFYKLNFWDSLNLDAFRSQVVANELYDTAVNMGVGVAAGFLQRSLNVMNKNGALWPDLAVDRRVGLGTTNAANAAPEGTLIKVLNCLQGARYVELCEADRSQEANFNGWLNNRVTI